MSDATAVIVTEPRKNLKSEHQALIATVRNDITIPYYSGALQHLDDTLIQRGGGKGLKIYDEIERDTHANSVLSKRKNELTAREWTVEPAGKDPADAEVADFISEMLQALPFDRICRDLLDATLKGFAVSEIVWARRGARIVPTQIVSHDQRRFVFDADWRLRLLTLKAMRDGLELDDRKFIVHRFGEKGNNPYGLGLGNRLFWPVLFKREGIAFWMTYLEKYASPTAVGKVAVGTSPEEQRQVLVALENIAQSRGITVPIGTELAFLEATRTGPASYEAWERYWDEQMSIGVLGETLSTVVGSVGSLAAANVHTEAKSQLIDADADLLSDTLQGSLFRWLVDYNFSGRRVPKLLRPRPKNEEALGKAREQIAKAEKAEIEAFEKALTLVAGMDEVHAISVLRSVSALAVRMEDAALKVMLKLPRPRAPSGPTAPKPELGQDAEDPEPAFSFAAPGGVLGKAHLPDAVFDAFEAALAAPVADWMVRAKASLAAATSLDEVGARILQLATELPIERLAARLAEAHVFAELLGRASAVVEAEEDGLTAADLFADAGADPDIVFEGAPMAEAMEFLRQKVALPQAGYATLLRQGHDRQFVVAGATREDLARDLQQMVIRNLEKGGLEGFRADFDKLLASGAWTGDGELLTSTKKRAWRTRTIFMTNLRTAHAAGRLKQQRALTDVLPFWQYRHGATRTPKRARQPHLRLNGLTLPADDAAWARIYAPNGWLCSCAVRAITAAAAGRVDKSSRRPPADYEIDAAVDPDWQYMPGDTWERGLVPAREAGMLDPSQRARPVQGSLTPLKSIARPIVRTMSPPSPGASEDELVDAFLGAFGASREEAALYRDKAGQQVVISRQLFEDRVAGGSKVKKQDRHLDLPALVETIKDPDEIWVDWQEPYAGMGGPRLVRTYIRRDPNTTAVSAFAWGSDGWDSLTAHFRTRGPQRKPAPRQLEELRHGALLYRRPGDGK